MTSPPMINGSIVFWSKCMLSILNNKFGSMTVRKGDIRPQYCNTACWCLRLTKKNVPPKRPPNLNTYMHGVYQDMFRKIRFRDYPHHKIFKKYNFASKIVDRKPIKFNIHGLKNAQCLILTYLES